MGWNEEEKVSNKGMDLSNKILISIIVCIVIIIILISVLLLKIKTETFKLLLNGAISKYSNDLITKFDDTTYIEISEFAKLVGYEYHEEEEYKSFTKEADKCYVKGLNETASFYLNDNKVCKLPIDKITEDYEEYITENTVQEKNGKMYASLEAISIAFNLSISETSNSLSIYTLDNLVTKLNTKVVKWGYSSITDQDFENKKALLYGYIIVKKENGLYKIIDTENTQEIVSDKYNSIEFIENTQEFFVTNSLGKVGIINLDGTTKIEPVYDSIKVLDKKSNLYLIEQNQKFGVIKSGNIMVIYPEYEQIGIDTTDMKNVESQYLLLDTIIPVCKDGKYGAFDKEGNLVYKVEYDGFGCNLTTVEVNGLKKLVNPVLTIEECNGIVVKKGEKYGLKDLKGKDLVSVSVNSIYSITEEDTDNTTTGNDKLNYYMIYGNKELDIIEMLIKAGIIEDTKKTATNDSLTNNTIANNSTENTTINETESNNTLNNSVQ